MADLGDALEALDRRSRESLVLYQLLRAKGIINSVLLAEIRCDDVKGCLLVRLFRTPAGTAYFLPAYKHEATRNAETSSDEGRQENTEDGDRKWKERAGQLSDAFNLTLNCDHTQDQVIELDGIEMGSPGRPLRRSLARWVALG